MKILLLVVILSGTIFQANSQVKPLATTSAELLEKSNAQYTAGWILLGTGTAFLLTSWAITPNYDYYDGSSNQTLDTVLALVGTASLIASVPVFMGAGRNARSAARLSLKNQAIHQPVIVPGQIKNIPSVSLKIPL